MTIRIALPEPTSTDSAYNARSLPPYIAALQSAGATPVIIPVHERQDRVARLLAGTCGVLLPGSGFDIEPERYGATRIPACGASDAGRSAVDELLLQDGFNLHKPIFAICYGMQALNVWLNGTLIQDLESVLKTRVNHAPGRDVQEAHPIRIAADSRLSEAAGGLTEEISNSSHHQAVERVGDNLKTTAISPDDGVIEAVELDSPSHFVVGVQWHPERTYSSSALSRALFAAFVKAASLWHPRPVEAPVAAV